MWVSFLFFVGFRWSRRRRRRRLIAPVRSVSLHPIGKPAPNYHILYLWGGRRFDQILGGIRQIFPIPPGLWRPQNGTFGPFSPITLFSLVETFTFYIFGGAAD